MIWLTAVSLWKKTLPLSISQTHPNTPFPESPWKSWKVWTSPAAARSRGINSLEILKNWVNSSNKKGVKLLSMKLPTSPWGSRLRMVTPISVGLTLFAVWLVPACGSSQCCGSNMSLVSWSEQSGMKSHILNCKRFWISKDPANQGPCSSLVQRLAARQFH